jgi:hypothetical protein
MDSSLCKVRLLDGLAGRYPADYMLIARQHKFSNVQLTIVLMRGDRVDVYTTLWMRPM